MNRQDLKNIVEQVMSENYGMSNSMGSGNNQMGFSRSERYEQTEESQLSEMQVEFEDILKNLSGDPGYEQAIVICKVLVKNKPILQELLEMMKNMAELQEEFIGKFRESQDM